MPLHITPGTINSGTYRRLWDFYDMNAFSEALNLTILDWTKVKLGNTNFNRNNLESIGCWTLFQWPSRGQMTWSRMGLNLTLWPPPCEITAFASFEALIYEPPYKHFDQLIEKNPIHFSLGVPRPIDSNLLCLADAFYLRSPQFASDGSPIHDLIEALDNVVWQTVTQYLHFNQLTLNRASDTLTLD